MPNPRARPAPSALRSYSAARRRGTPPTMVALRNTNWPPSVWMISGAVTAVKAPCALHASGAGLSVLESWCWYCGEARSRKGASRFGGQVPNLIQTKVILAAHSCVGAAGTILSMHSSCFLTPSKYHANSSKSLDLHLSLGTEIRSLGRQLSGCCCSAEVLRWPPMASETRLLRSSADCFLHLNCSWK